MLAFELIAVGRMGEVVPGDEFFDQLVIPGNAQGAEGLAHGALDVAPLFPREENVDPLRFHPLLGIQLIDIVGNRRGIGRSGDMGVHPADLVPGRVDRRGVADARHQAVLDQLREIFFDGFHGEPCPGAHLEARRFHQLLPIPLGPAQQLQIEELFARGPSCERPDGPRHDRSARTAKAMTTTFLHGP